MAKKPIPKLELSFSIFLIGLSIVVSWETLSLPPGSFDPLGSAGFPRIISLVIGILSLTLFIRSIRGISPDTKKSSALTAYKRRSDLAIVFYGFAMLYVLALALKLFSFAISTALFLVIIMGVLIRFEFKRMPLVIVIALLIGFGCQYIFTQIFVIDLP